MKKLSTKQILNKLHASSYTRSTPYKFAKNYKKFSPKEIKGALAVFKWFDNLVFAALDEEKRILLKLRQTLLAKKENIKPDLNEEYRKGVEEVLEMLINDFDSVSKSNSNFPR